MKKLLVIVVVAILCVGGGFSISAARARGELMQVDGRNAFVYPDGDQVVLVLARGEYAMDGTSVEGCYELIPAGWGEERGRAVRLGDVCMNGGH